jgi:hypothetical protein
MAAVTAVFLLPPVLVIVMVVLARGLTRDLTRR